MGVVLNRLLAISHKPDKQSSFVVSHILYKSLKSSISVFFDFDLFMLFSEVIHCCCVLESTKKN